MSRGHGNVQSYLADLILSSPEPMTFADILAIAYPEGGFEGDMAKVLGKSNVGAVRSLRRALKQLCDNGTVMMIGEGGRGDPYRYWLDPMMLAMFGSKDAYAKVSERIAADPALAAAADASARRIFARWPTAPRSK